MDGGAEVLIGAWRLERWEIVASDGTRHHPFGAQPAGLLIYTADGCMSACIMVSSATADTTRVFRAGRSLRSVADADVAMLTHA